MLTSVYAGAHGVSIPSSLAFSEECLTRPLDGQTIENICAVLIRDDGPVAGKVVVESSLGVDDNVNTGKNDKKYWIILVTPEQKCRVVGRCKFWLCSSRSRNIPSEASTSTAYISPWSEWAWDARSNKWGRYRLSQGRYEYDWRDPDPSTSSTS
jgi:hypothetical protein